MIEGLKAGVVVVREDGVILYANSFAAGMLRRATKDLVGRNIGDALAPLADLRRGAEQPVPRQEIDLHYADGTAATLGYSLSGPNADGSWTVLCQDITAILALRAERDRLLQLAALGDALPTILHELRNPLAAVTSALEVLQEDAPQSCQQDLQTILHEVQRMGLSLAGVGGLARPLHCARPAAIDHALRQACRILQPTAARHSVTIVDAVTDLPPLQLDWAVISGVVFNLVKNAIDACRANDTVEVRAFLREAHALRLEVVDSGVGMDRETLKHCTELFFTQKAKGSGIGLALCQQIADLSGGRLEIHSEKDRGTTVAFEVPLQERVVPPRGGAPEPRMTTRQSTQPLAVSPDTSD